MTLICRPPGRGNWRIVRVTIDAPADLFRFQRNMRFSLGAPPVVLRIVQVLP